jgi:hypothetical protein
MHLLAQACRPRCPILAFVPRTAGNGGDLVERLPSLPDGDFWTAIPSQEKHDSSEGAPPVRSVHCRTTAGKLAAVPPTLLSIAGCLREHKLDAGRDGAEHSCSVDSVRTVRRITGPGIDQTKCRQHPFGQNSSSIRAVL